MQKMDKNISTQAFEISKKMLLFDFIISLYYRYTYEEYYA